MKLSCSIRVGRDNKFYNTWTLGLLSKTVAKLTCLASGTGFSDGSFTEETVPVTVICA
ncbi:MAG: hypothetical protein Q4D10_01530 [Bacteroidales bacterium]|nr:hypothetical protein [Bacteroidales bacterium]